MGISNILYTLVCILVQIKHFFVYWFSRKISKNNLSLVPHTFLLNKPNRGDMSKLHYSSFFKSQHQPPPHTSLKHIAVLFCFLLYFLELWKSTRPWITLFLPCRIFSVVVVVVVEAFCTCTPTTSTTILVASTTTTTTYFSILFLHFSQLRFLLFLTLIVFTYSIHFFSLFCRLLISISSRLQDTILNFVSRNRESIFHPSQLRSYSVRDGFLSIPILSLLVLNSLTFHTQVSCFYFFLFQYIILFAILYSFLSYCHFLSCSHSTGISMCFLAFILVFLLKHASHLLKKVESPCGYHCQEERKKETSKIYR